MSHFPEFPDEFPCGTCGGPEKYGRLHDLKYVGSHEYRPIMVSKPKDYSVVMPPCGYVYDNEPSLYGYICGASVEDHSMMSHDYVDLSSEDKQFQPKGGDAHDPTRAQRSATHTGLNVTAPLDTSTPEPRNITRIRERWTGVIPDSLNQAEKDLFDLLEALDDAQSKILVYRRHNEQTEWIIKATGERLNKILSRAEDAERKLTAIQSVLETIKYISPGAEWFDLGPRGYPDDPTGKYNEDRCDNDCETLAKIVAYNRAVSKLRAALDGKL